MLFVLLENMNQVYKKMSLLYSFIYLLTFYIIYFSLVFITAFHRLWYLEISIKSYIISQGVAEGSEDVCPWNKSLLLPLVDTIGVSGGPAQDSAVAWCSSDNCHVPGNLKNPALNSKNSCPCKYPFASHVIHFRNSIIANLFSE